MPCNTGSLKKTRIANKVPNSGLCCQVGQPCGSPSVGSQIGSSPCLCVAFMKQRRRGDKCRRYEAGLLNCAGGKTYHSRSDLLTYQNVVHVHVHVGPTTSSTHQANVVPDCVLAHIRIVVPQSIIIVAKLSRVLSTKGTLKKCLNKRVFNRSNQSTRVARPTM